MSYLFFDCDCHGNKIGPPEYWFRYEDVSYSVCFDPDANYYGSELKVELRKYPVLKHTQTGVWIKMGVDLDDDYNRVVDKRFVKRDCRKRFAAPTLELAKKSFIARKKKQAAIFRARAEKAEKAIRLIEGKMW